MGFFDVRILTVLKDSIPKSFISLLSEVDFSHNTLQEHLDRLMARALLLGKNLLEQVLEDPILSITSHPKSPCNSL
jgi:hypothetical protein